MWWMLGGVYEKLDLVMGGGGGVFEKMRAKYGGVHLIPVGNILNPSGTPSPPPPPPPPPHPPQDHKFWPVR